MNIHGIDKGILSKSKASVRNGISYEDDLRTVAGLPPGRLFMWAQPDRYDFTDPQRAADQVHSKLQEGAKGVGELNVTGLRSEVILEDHYPTMEVAESLNVPVFYGTRAGAGAEREIGNIGIGLVRQLLTFVFSEQRDGSCSSSRRESDAARGVPSPAAHR